MTLRITILIDNRAPEGLIAEHGFSAWIEVGEQHILFDTGKNGRIADNASLLGIALSKTDFIVLSHGHCDHSGGLPQILRLAPKAEVCLHPAAVAPRCSIVAGIVKSIGMPPASQVALDRMALEKLHWLQNEYRLTQNIGLTGPIPRLTAFEDIDGSFFLDQRGQRPDLIDDDLALWLATANGLIIIVGCAHAGLVNTLDQISRLTGGLPVRVIIGGFHLKNADSQRLHQTVTALHKYHPELIVPCHCTGNLAVSVLQDAFGERVCQGMTGMVCRLDRQNRLTISQPIIAFGLKN
jgi:7,8-dihydropterin-6-yl-methyl-4-(beta-D-ribofuranosyl)aminobenzene 5'-phosphate synthase